MDTGVKVIGLFRGFFEGLSGVIDFLMQSYTISFGDKLTISFTPLNAFVGASLGLLLTITLTLHIWHLVKLVL